MLKIDVKKRLSSNVSISLNIHVNLGNTTRIRSSIRTSIIRFSILKYIL